jgi:hypothetical protein
MLLGETAKTFPVVGNFALVHKLTGGVDGADGMVLVTHADVNGSCGRVRKRDGFG